MEMILTTPRLTRRVRCSRELLKSWSASSFLASGRVEPDGCGCADGAKTRPERSKKSENVRAMSVNSILRPLEPRNFRNFGHVDIKGSLIVQNEDSFAKAFVGLHEVA